MPSSVKGFRALDVNTVVDYLAERRDLATRVGPSGSHSSWQVRGMILTCCTTAWVHTAMPGRLKHPSTLSLRAALLRAILGQAFIPGIGLLNSC